MNRKTLGIIFLLSGTLLFVGGLMAGISSFLGMMNGLDPIAEFKSPAETTVEITQPGTHTLWLDHRYHTGKTVEQTGTNLPPDFTFTLTGPTEALFTPIKSGSSQTVTTNTRESLALGSFEVNTTGTYTLRGSNPASDPYRFSLTQGAFLEHLGGFVGKAFLWGILAFIGLVLAVIGIIMMILKGKKAAPDLPPA